MKRWWRRDRTRYAVMQVQGGKEHRIVGGLTLKDAQRDAAQVNGHLALFKLMAPSGPQDTHAVVVPETSEETNHG